MGISIMMATSKREFSQIPSEDLEKEHGLTITINLPLKMSVPSVLDSTYHHLLSPKVLPSMFVIMNVINKLNGKLTNGAMPTTVNQVPERCLPESPLQLMLFVKLKFLTENLIHLLHLHTTSPLKVNLLHIPSHTIKDGWRHVKFHKTWSSVLVLLITQYTLKMMPLFLGSPELENLQCGNILIWKLNVILIRCAQHIKLAHNLNVTPPLEDLLVMNPLSVVIVMDSKSVVVELPVNPLSTSVLNHSHQSAYHNLIVIMIVISTTLATTVLDTTRRLSSHKELSLRLLD